jgi:sarcosine oxidase delta subunit
MMPPDHSGRLQAAYIELAFRADALSAFVAEDGAAGSVRKLPKHTVGCQRHFAVVAELLSRRAVQLPRAM